MLIYLCVKILAISVILVLAELSWTQILIPFGFWNNTSATLVISDATTYNYGSINISTPTDKTFSVSNTGNAAAFSMTAFAFTNPTVYTFKGGTYPGTGGTCLATLQVSSSCTIVVTASRATTGTVTDTIQINYRRKTAEVSATRPITATFTNVATQLAWITTPSFIKINECQAVTVQRQDSAGNPVTTALATAITSLLFNNGTTGTYYSNSGCATVITTSSIAASTNSITIYFRNTTSGQTGILVATAAGLTSASQNVTITTAPTKLFINPSPTIKTATCAPVPINSVDANNFNSNAGATVTVNLTTTGANIYYSDSGCSLSITATTILAGTNARTVYTQNGTIQAATLTATDAAALLTASSKVVNFNTTLTWWNAAWTNRIRIDINNSDQATAFTNQPVLVKINSSMVNYSNIKANGADIRVVASDNTTLLNYEFDKWNSGGTSEIWAQVPNIAASSSANHIFLYYNNPVAADAQNSAGVWTNYWSVWHLGNDPAGTAPQYLDSAATRNGTATNAPVRTVGQIGDGADLNGTTDAIDINSDLSLTLGRSSTLSFWMRTTQTGDNTSYLAPGITGIEQAGGANDIFFGWIDGGGLIGVTAGNGANAKSTFVVNNNAWRHVTITRASVSGLAEFYINGILSNSATSETGDKTTYFDLLGEIGDTGGSPTNYNGMIDEVRIINSVRTAAQIRADFKYMVNTHVIYNSFETGP